MAKTTRTLTALGFQQAGGTEDWRVLGNGACAWFRTLSHAQGGTLAQRLAELGPAGATPDLSITAEGVRLRIPLGPTDGGFSAAHVDLARAVSEAAADLGLMADPTTLQDLQLAVDTMDQSAIAPFWEAALGYEPVGDEDLLDPARRHPPIWFQDQDAPRPLRNRLHVDSVVPQEIARQTLPALEGRGASRVDDHGYYATVADAEGNEVDVLPLPEGADRWDGSGTADWRLVFSAMACYPTDDPRQAAELAVRVASLADEAGLPLGIDLRPGRVILDSGKDRWEMVEGYEALAARVQEAARGMGLEADVMAPRFLQAVIDAVDIPAVRGFWRAALGYVDDSRAGVTDLVDPRHLGMPLVLQGMHPTEEDRRAQRNRIHVDLFVPDDQVQSRIDAALAAGGRVAFDGNAPDGVTIADPEGNEIDFAVSVGREERWEAGRTSS